MGSAPVRPRRRYAAVSEKKAHGATYTPETLARFVAENMIKEFEGSPANVPLRILDPALGDGELLLSLLRALGEYADRDIHVFAFEPNREELEIARRRLQDHFPGVQLHLKADNFLEYVLENFREHPSLFDNPDLPDNFDLIIANPPYVRTQIIGAWQARVLSEQFDLSGRIDLYYAFILAMARVLKPRGVAGIIVSNRFMTTRSGSSIRRAILQQLRLRHIWDLGDTKLFDAAVLPAVLIAEGRNGHKSSTSLFSSIYESHQEAEIEALNPIEALSLDGLVQIPDGRRFLVRHGHLAVDENPESVWRIATEGSDAWLATVQAHTWGTFRDIGKIRVGVKTCADRIFIRSDWDEMPDDECPELIRPLLTHHNARRYKAFNPEKQRQILYPHIVENNCRRPANLTLFPRSRAYLEKHRQELESRKYVLEAGRQWYEVWVPQDPSSWQKTKLVFRDIAEDPAFWIDHEGSVVNGDCYWLICDKPECEDLLWLAAAVGNSSFITRFYDIQFNNKLYAGRRRFITQYVEKFPLPDPNNSVGKQIIAKAKEAAACIPGKKSETLEHDLDRLVWRAFGLSVEKIAG
ncbi:MAG: N-6 DNA methylase [Actinobacteria bacterium]|nr:N-6 DNA methylase [Actinomycetota bacterium]